MAIKNRHSEKFSKKKMIILIYFQKEDYKKFQMIPKKMILKKKKMMNLFSVQMMKLSIITIRLMKMIKALYLTKTDFSISKQN